MRSLLLSAPLILMSLALLSSACGEFEPTNSFSQDQELYQAIAAIDTTTDAGARFSAARDVFERKCTGCHGLVSHSFHVYEEGDFVGYYVTAGDSGSSRLYRYLKGSGLSPATMPEGASLSTEDLETLKDWIDGLE